MALRLFGSSALRLFGFGALIACNGADKDSNQPDDTDSEFIGIHSTVDCEQHCDVKLKSYVVDSNDLESCLSQAARTQWLDAGWNFVGGAYREVVHQGLCEERLCFDDVTCDDIGGGGPGAACDAQCAETMIGQVPPGDTSSITYWNDLFDAQKLPGCTLSLDLTYLTECVDEPPSCSEAPNADQGDCSPAPEANFDFVVDPILSNTVITVPGVGSASVPMTGRLYVSSSPSEFLAGSVDGPGVTLGGFSYAATHAWFDIPIDIATSGTSFTVTPSEASKAWAAGYIASSSLFEFFDLQPTQTTTGSINPTAGTWQMSYTVYKPYGSIVVTMGGAIEAN